jgi:uncharacterized protein YjbJ (UPF0337 family)
MNKHQVKGRVEQAKGAVKEGTGRVLDNERLEAEGMIDKTVGKAQAEYGDAKERTQDMLDKERDRDTLASERAREVTKKGR